MAYHVNRNAIVISFRGTVDLKNFIADALFFHTKYPHCKGCFVHAGIYWGYLSIKNQMINAIN